MQIPKPTADDKAYFESIVPDGPGIEIKPMFGNVAAFVNGTMFMGLFGPDVGIRLPEGDRERLLDILRRLEVKFIAEPFSKESVLLVGTGPVSCAA